MKPFLPFVIISALFAANGLAVADESQWDRFRGPNGTGVLGGATPPAELSETTMMWKTELPVGFSSPVVWNDLIFLTGLDEGRLTTLCVNGKSGELVWKQAAPEVPLEELHEANHPTTPTPVVDQDRVYAYFGSFGVICYDHEGHEIWQRQLPVKQRGYGTSTSPILYTDLLILVLDDRENTSHILAMNKADGTTKWETARPFLRSNGYSTPVIWKNGEREEIVVLGFEHVNSYNGENGEELWYLTGLSRQPIPVPMVSAERLYVAAADRGGEGGNPSDPQLEWQGLAYFDADKDGSVEFEEMTEGFGFPLRPELHPTHPGWGFPITDDNGKKWFLERFDVDKNGGITKEEYLQVAGGRENGNNGRHALMAIRPGAKGNAMDSHVEWNVRRNIAEIPTPVLYDNKLYSVRDGGTLTCFNAEDGDIIFSGRIRRATGQYCASAIAADGKIYVASAEGVVTVLEAGSELNILSQHDFDEEIYATPALHKNAIYVRTKQHLYAFATDN